MTKSATDHTASVQDRQNPPNARARILDAGQRALREHGFFGISVRQIAREVGVHPALIGHYFGDKKGLLSEIEQLIRSRRPDDVETPVRIGAGEAPWE